jgi:anhydro-N-acetylmuramic acid kinase
MKRLIVGCMTGTSLDSIDVALVEIEGQGLAMKPRLVGAESESLRSLAKLLRPLTQQKRATAGQFARNALMLGTSHMLAVKKLAQGAKLDLVVVHGQTIYHELHVTWQLFNPWPIVAELNVPVVFDLRWADLVSGGEGAPITPLADHILFRDSQMTQVVVNLGGFANYTWLPATRNEGAAALGSIRGGDVCACNQLLDAVARLALKKHYDADGATALSGEVNDESMEFLLMMLRHQAEGGRSLGTGDEAVDWVRIHRGEISAADLARTACAAIAQTICETIGPADRLILAGGGAFNQALVAEITERFSGKVVLSTELGVPVQFREAMEMAILGALAQDGVPISLPQVTGRAETTVRAGCWVYPS